MDKDIVYIILKLIQEKVKEIKEEPFSYRYEFLRGKAAGLALALEIAKALPDEEIEELMNEIIFL